MSVQQQRQCQICDCLGLLGVLEDVTVSRQFGVTRSASSHRVVDTRFIAYKLESVTSYTQPIASCVLH